MTTENKTIKKSVIIGPRATEKAAIKSTLANVHVFNVTREATKKSVMDAIRLAYKITPVDVRLLAIPKKKIFYRGRPGVKGGGKKAYVYLKKGDKIETI